eukprot:PhF_6_TR19590/c0_g1_i3/m.28571
MNTLFRPDLTILVAQIQQKSKTYSRILSPPLPPTNPPTLTTNVVVAPNVSLVAANSPTSPPSLLSVQSPQSQQLTPPPPPPATTTAPSEADQLVITLQHVLAYCSKSDGVKKFARIPNAVVEVVALVAGYTGGFPTVLQYAFAILSALACVSEVGVFLLQTNALHCIVHAWEISLFQGGDGNKHEQVGMNALMAITNVLRLQVTPPTPNTATAPNTLPTPTPTNTNTTLTDKEIIFIKNVVLDQYKSSTVIAEQWCHSIDVIARHSPRALAVLCARPNSNEEQQQQDPHAIFVVEEVMQLHGHVLGVVEKGWRCLATLSKAYEK